MGNCIGRRNYVVFLRFLTAVSFLDLAMTVRPKPAYILARMLLFSRLATLGCDQVSVGLYVQGDAQQPGDAGDRKFTHDAEQLPFIVTCLLGLYGLVMLVSLMSL